MSKPQTATNPFYIALVAVGIFFSVTACAYCVMAFRAVQRPGLASGRSGDGDRVEVSAAAKQPALLDFLDEHGMALMGGQLLLLAICTFGAMAYDKRLTEKEAKTTTAAPAGPVREP